MELGITIQARPRFTEDEDTFKWRLTVTASGQ
jgi:hypothetical protein